MSSTGGQEKRYTDREVRAIFARLSELQARQESAATGSGTTLRQLQSASAELGLDTELLQQAVDEMTGRPEIERGSVLFGGPRKVSFDQIVPGFMDSESWPAFVQDIRAKTGSVGAAENSGSLFEWKIEPPDGLHLSLSPSGENTRVRVSASFGTVPAFMEMFGTFLGFMFGAMIGSSLQPAGSHSLATTLSIIASLFIGSGVGFLAGRLASIPVVKRKLAATRDFIAFVERRVAQQQSLAPSNRQRFSQFAGQSARVERVSLDR